MNVKTTLNGINISLSISLIETALDEIPGYVANASQKSVNGKKVFFNFLTFISLIIKNLKLSILTIFFQFFFTIFLKFCHYFHI